MENLSRIIVSLAYAGKTGILLTGQLGKDPVTDSKWCKNTIGSGDRYEVNPKSWTQHLLFICEEEH